MVRISFIIDTSNKNKQYTNKMAGYELKETVDTMRVSLHGSLKSLLKLIFTNIYIRGCFTH